MTEKQTAANLNLSPRTLQRFREQGTGPKYLRLGARRIGYKITDIENWLDSCAHQNAVNERAAKQQSPFGAFPANHR